MAKKDTIESEATKLRSYQGKLDLQEEEGHSKSLKTKETFFLFDK